MGTFKLANFTCDFEVLYLAVVNNIDYFYFYRDKYWYAGKFVLLLRELLSHLHWYEDNLKQLQDEAYRYDFNEVRGNGFRSFNLIFERCFSECYSFCKTLCVVRSSFLFRAGSYLSKTESLISVLDGLRPGLKYIIRILNENYENCHLMADKAFTAEEIIAECGGISQLGFYGQYQGFYYCTSMRRILQGVSVIMATFSDLYQSSGSPVSRAVLAVIHGVKYIINPELRAQQIVDVAQNSSVEFLKAFWSLSETPFMKKLPAWVCPKLEVREDIFIPSEPVTLVHTETNEYVVISPPSSHIAPAPIRCLLLSAVHREGQVVNKNGRKKNSKPRSRSLLFHCHGGGFISQTPESHEIYLRNWAHDLNVPILSVDYTLSPQAPFPRALEEVLLAYAWALNNADKLGWTGENICFAGDSAGGNILMGIVLKCISLKIRQPDAVLCAYTPLILDMMPSPSRLLCWIDPLLPLGFMISCLDAYAGAMQTDGDEYEEEPNHGASGTRSRKISSISEIFDSSVMFLKQYEWTEVEANEPSDVDLDVSAFGYEKETLNKPDKNDYIHDFLKECCSSIVNISSEDDEDHMEHDVFNLSNNIMFDIKEKFCAFAHSAINKLSQAFISTSLYQKVISPFIPLKIFPHQVVHSPFRSSSKSSILQKIRKLKIVSRNPFMSPLLASEEFLKQMPPIYFVSLNFDPCLDDSITFAKRLAAANRHVVVDVLDGLPHGFLNFLPFSQEAHNGSNLCVRRLSEAMNLLLLTRGGRQDEVLLSVLT